jgi:hypothetical protein
MASCCPHTILRCALPERSSSRVYAPDEIDRLLKDGHQSRKIGKIIAKGHRRGWPIFTLTLEERATCPAPAVNGPAATATACRQPSASSMAAT